MNYKKRVLIKSSFLGLSGIGMYKSLSMAYACSSESYENIEYPSSALTNLTDGPMARYIDKYYPQGERRYGFMISIETKKFSDNHIVPITVSLAFRHHDDDSGGTIKKHWDDPKGLICSQIDVLSQQINSFQSGEYIDSKNRKWTDTKGEKEGLVYKVASYHFGSETQPYVSFRYRRIFKKSRIIVVAILIDKVTKERREILVSHTEVLRGGDICGGEIILI